MIAAVWNPVASNINNKKNFSFFFSAISYANKTNDLVILDGTFETAIKIIFAVKEGTSNKEILNLINGKESKGTIWL